MRTASPALRGSEYPWPAALSPTIRNRPGASEDRNAHPSMAELVKGGWSRRAVTSCASTLPIESANRTNSAGLAAISASIAARAASTVISFMAGTSLPTCRRIW